MNLTKKEIKKIIGIICFAIAFYFILENLETVKNIIDNILNTLSPFFIAILQNKLIPLNFFISMHLVSEAIRLPINKIIAPTKL